MKQFNDCEVRMDNYNYSLFIIPNNPLQLELGDEWNYYNRVINAIVEIDDQNNVFVLDGIFIHIGYAPEYKKQDFEYWDKIPDDHKETTFFRKRERLKTGYHYCFVKSMIEYNRSFINWKVKINL